MGLGLKSGPWARTTGPKIRAIFELLNPYLVASIIKLHELNSLLLLCNNGNPIMNSLLSSQCSFRLRLQLYPSARIGRPRDAVTMAMNGNFGSATTNKFPRRMIVEFVSHMSFIHLLNPAFAAPIPATEEPEVIRTLKLDSGVRIQEIIEGEGPEAQEGDVVEVNYVCRRSNGYFVHSTVDQFSGESSPVILPLNENQIIKGLKEVLVGMKVGGKRRALIPPSAGYVSESLKPIPDEFGPRRSLLTHAREPLVFEVQLLKVL
ncbi:unnamed protein product [Linum tenue]|uniref:peptidylprolyl isomerase n=1 Tax=Linum tenue TaxID=586396 RepID=A0AAV0N3M9_9ROSI|nr:unnamed protein product [Linum tenue]